MRYGRLHLLFIHLILLLLAAGWSGGLRQSFHLELWDGEERHLLRNVSQQKRPKFELSSLQSGKRLIIKIYSANKKGKYDHKWNTLEA